MDDLFSSNRQPSPYECASARNLLQLCDTELTLVEHQLATLQKQVEELTSRRSAIQTNKTKYMDILSARRRLPPEIIVYFMQLAVACPDEDHLSQPRRARFGSVLPFMLVSKEWYETVCSFAHFWTELNLNVTGASGTTLHILEMASKRVQRASELPLSLTITLSSSNPHNDKIAQFAHSVAVRTGTFNIFVEVQSEPDEGLLAGLLHHPLSSCVLVWRELHTLRIGTESRGTFYMNSQLGEAFTDAERFPALRNVEIIGPQNISVVTMPWKNLSTLHLGSLHTFQFGDLFSVLGQSSNLESLNLSIRGGVTGSYPPEANSLLTLPRLTHLNVKYAQCNEIFVVVLLAWLQLPSIQFLACTATDGPSTSIIRSLTQLFQRSGCQESIRHLELDLGMGLGQAAADLRTMFRETPRLSSLKISGQRLHAGCLSSIPDSVRDLIVELSFPVVDDARTSFIEFLRSRSHSFSFSSHMKARLDFVDSMDTGLIRENLAALKAESNGNLRVLMNL
ncbi:hypothetical protein MD484_g4564, partial [Candolleomyces efflorescens]